MRKLNLILTVIFVALLSVACNDSQVECPDNPLVGNKHNIVFKGSIGELMTRAGYTEWDAGDAIGVYALSAGQTLSQGVYDSKANIKYTTGGDGKFVAANVSEAILLPEDGSKLDFIAYYPYQKQVANNIVAVNLSNQSNPALIDLLYSNDAKNADNSSSVIAMLFKHMLSKVVLTVKAEAGTSLQGISSSFNNVLVDGTFNLENGTITSGSTKQTTTPNISFTANNTEAVVTAILMPGQSLSDLTIKFNYNGKKYEWTPQAQIMLPSTKYSYNLTLNTGGEVVAVKPNGTIEDWVEGNAGGTDVTLTPSEGVVFTVDKQTISVEAETNLVKNLKLTADAAQAWTAESSATWLTISPANGTGNADISLTTQANTGAERSANVTIKGGGQSDIIVTVTQAAKATTPPSPTSGVNLFPGSDFEDWSVFTGALNKYGVKDYVTQSTDGRNGTKAMKINATPEKNDYVFTAVVPSGMNLSEKSKISFYVKGTVSGRSISINVYKSTKNSKGWQEYYAFNIGTLDTNDLALTTAEKNAYDGSIDTQGNWVKVTLDISGLADLATSESMFALKVGKGVAWDVLIDDITVE